MADFNSDNAKIDAALCGKLNHWEMIQEITANTTMNIIEINLSALDWNQWEYITITLACPRDSNTSGIMYFDLNGLLCYGAIENNLGKRSPGPLLVVLPVRHNGSRPIRMTIFPGGDLAFSNSAFQALTKFRLLCSGSNSNIPAGAKVWVKGLR